MLPIILQLFLRGLIGVFPAVFEIGDLVLPDQRHHAGPQPVRCIQRFGAVAFQFDVPLTQLKPGTYVCQVNVIDDAGGSFSFPRMALRIQPGTPAVVAPATTPTASVTPSP